MLQLPVHLLGILYVRLISALGANRMLTIGAAVSLVVNVLLNVFFMRRFGVAGIALSTACVYLVSCVFLGVASHRALLQHSQQLDLQAERQLAHFVEQHRAAGGLAEQAPALAGRARERALFVAEQLALHQRLG